MNKTTLLFYSVLYDTMKFVVKTETLAVYKKLKYDAIFDRKKATTCAH